MADHTKPRTGRGLALILTMLLLLATGCKSTGADADSGSSGGSGGAPAAMATTAPGATTTKGTPEKLCGSPPCVRYLSRGDTKSLSDTLTDHPLASTIAVHVALSMLCGGILCLLGEGVSLPFVEHKTREAADQHACLKVSILPDKDKFSLMNITASNDKPYCTD